MASEHTEYNRVPDKEEWTFDISPNAYRNCTFTPTYQSLVVLLIISSLGHLLWLAIFTLHFCYSSTRTCGPEISPYAGLAYDVPVPFRDVTAFVHYDRVVADATWDSWVIEPGMVSLSHSYVNEKMLPVTQNSPLDEEKGVYILSSYHSLHCLKQLRDSFINAATGIPGDGPNGTAFDHNLHCFEFLRQDIICHADDTPRYTGLSKGEVPGMMQTRVCRSWDKMEAWARSNTACFRDMSQDVEGFPVLNHSTYCPNGYVFSSDGTPIPPWNNGENRKTP